MQGAGCGVQGAAMDPEDPPPLVALLVPAQNSPFEGLVACCLDEGVVPCCLCKGLSISGS